MSSVDLVLAAYNSAGCGVVEHVAGRADVDRLIVFTHEPPSGVPDVRQTAERLGIAWTTDRLSVDALPFRPDVIASIYYRHIIAPSVIDACDGRIFNAHPSLLPRHRGCSSIPWSIIEGDSLTGVTFHYIDEGIDTGRILLQSVLPIAPDETQSTLYTRAASRVVVLWPAALQLVISGFPGIDQEGPTCYHPRGAPCGGEIDDSWSDAEVDRFIRALTFPPYPLARYCGAEITSLPEYLALRPDGRA